MIWGRLAGRKGVARISGKCRTLNAHVSFSGRLSISRLMISFPNAPSLLPSVTSRVHRNHVVTTSDFSSNYNGCYTRAARLTNI